MSSRKVIVGALILGGVLASGLAQARDDIQWSVTIGTPIGVPVYSQAYPVYSHPVPVYSHPVPVYTRPAPVVVHRPDYYGRHHVAPIAWDRDRDGIPNRYDRVYNPRWDRDGDGIPNRHDRVYNPRWDRDGDGIPNRHDRYDNRGGHR
jgi:hypothetical protein